ncbi:ATP-binding protein [Algibacter sp. 2305UL17-15]|uniref:tetratricopeptide repeat-containing sensor histidine kinase n=1 Tax=Algibacter sp. 2305UL17-15 TaxID=3231268 RepID=UPI00345ABA18
MLVFYIKYFSPLPFILIIFSLLSTSHNAQNKEFELRNRLNNSSDSTRIKTYYDLANLYYETTGKGDSMISFGQKIHKFSKHNSNIDDEIGGLRLIGSGYMINRVYDKAEDYLTQGLSLAQSNTHLKELAEIHNRLGGLYQNTDKLSTATHHFLKAIKHAENVSDFKTLAMACYGISVIYSTQNQTEKQLEYLLKATNLCDTKSDIAPLAKSIIYGSAAQQYAVLASRPKFQNYKDSSFIFAEKTLKISKKHHLNQRIPSDLIVLSSYHINNGDIDQGRLYAEEAITYSSTMKTDTKLNVFMTLAHIYKAQNNKELCYAYLDSLKNMELKERPYYGSIIEKYRYTSYKHFNDFDLAFEALDSYFDFETKKKEIEQNKAINELETKYQTELKDAEIKRLWIFLAIAIAFILLGGFILKWMQLRKSREKNLALKEAIRQQIELEKELVNVRNNIAQDFHDDLGNKLARISFLSRLVEDELSEANKDVKEKVTQVKEDTISLYVGTKDFIFSLKPNSDYLEEVIMYLSDFAEDYFDKTNIDFILKKNSDLNKKLPHYWSKQLIYVFKEAMTNAFKHSKCDTLILKFEYAEGILRISCEDNGIGIEPSNLNSKNGLLNMKKRAEKIGGTLEIISIKNEGTTVFFKGKTEQTY